MARRMAKGFATARRVAIRRGAVGRAANSVVMAVPSAVGVGLVGLAFGMGMPAAIMSLAHSGYSIYRSVKSFNNARAVATRSSAGVARMDAARAVMAARPTVRNTRAQMRVAAGRLALARAAATRAAIEARTTNVLGMRARAAAQRQGSDGMVDSYTRVQNGRAVQVQGYSRR